MPTAGGSKVGQEVLYHDREVNHERLYRDCFFDTPTYGLVKFRRRYRMKRDLFVRIVDAVAKFDPWFVQKCDAVGRLGLSTLQKCIVVICMLAYNLLVDACNDYCRLGESTTIECLKRFVVAIQACFQSTYLKQPTREDIER